MADTDRADSLGFSTQESAAYGDDNWTNNEDALADCDYPRMVYLSELPQYVGLCAWWAFKTWGKYNPSYTLTKRIESFASHCNQSEIPLTILYLNKEGQPEGMASLRKNDGIRPDAGPWLASVYVEPNARRKGLGSWLVRQIQNKARELEYEKIYLLTYEQTLPKWYTQLGWKTIGQDVCHGNPVTVMEIDLFS